MPPKTARRPQHGEESRRRILDATTEIASERGYEGTTISLVSKRSGLPASSIYWHFANKDDLLAAVIDRSYDEWTTRRRAWVPSEGTSERRALLHEMLGGVAASIEEMPEFLRLGLMLCLEQRPVEAAARERYVVIRGERVTFLTGWFAGLLGELPADQAHEHGGRLAAFVLAMADGLFLARQVDPVGSDLRAQFADLADMLDDRCSRLLGS